MMNVTRRASRLATVILFATGFAVLATTVQAVPAISPTGAARMEREKAEARESALRMQKQAAPTRDDLRKECLHAGNAAANC